MADCPVRRGIPGTGGIAGTFAADLRLTGSGVAAAAGSRSQAPAGRFAGRSGIPRRHGSYESLAAGPDIDVTYVAAPRPVHHGNAVLALRAGKAVLTCTLRAKSPAGAAIAGTDARIEAEGAFYAPAAVTLIPGKGDPARAESRHEGRGLRHQADEVARRLAARATESPLTPLDETVSITETTDTALAQARRDA